MDDDRRPYLCGTGGRMIELPHRGNQLVVKCRDCGRQAHISGRTIVSRFTRWLRAPVADWASTLSCSACGSRWIMVSAERDPGADGFQLSTQDDGRIIWARRLNMWLADVDDDVWSYADVLEDHPISAELERAGLKRQKPAPADRGGL